jgi:hypothetical protein
LHVLLEEGFNFKYLNQEGSKKIYLVEVSNAFAELVDLDAEAGIGSV